MKRDVLIVEDDPALGLSIAELLTTHGYGTLVTHDEVAARRALESSAPAPCLILVGVLAPHRVRRLLRFLRSHHRAIPTVIMSTGGGGEVARPSRDGLAPVVIGRPADEESLLQVVSRFCAHPALRAAVN